MPLRLHSRRTIILSLFILLVISTVQASVLHRHGRGNIRQRHHWRSTRDWHNPRPEPVHQEQLGLYVRDAKPMLSKEKALNKDLNRLKKFLPRLKDDFLGLYRTLKALVGELEHRFGTAATQARLPETSIAIIQPEPQSSVAQFVPSHPQLSGESTTHAHVAAGPPSPSPMVATLAKVSQPLSDTCSEGEPTVQLRSTAQQFRSVSSTSRYSQTSEHQASYPYASLAPPATITTGYSSKSAGKLQTTGHASQSTLPEESRVIPNSGPTSQTPLTSSTTTLSITSTITRTGTTTKTISTSTSTTVSILQSSSVIQGFNPQATDNIAVYYGQTPPTTADGLLALCVNPSITIINLAFVATFFGPDGYPSTYFGPACSTSQNSFQASTAPGLQNCTYLGQQITACQQQYGKKIFVSLGGYIASSSFPSSPSASSFATTLWNLFGAGNGTGNPTSTSPSQNAQLRPFGPNVIVDGFDIDNEDHSTAYWLDFAIALRAHYASRQAAASAKQYYLSSTPQCPRPDASIPLAVLRASDFVNVQFYNNPPCNLDAGAAFVDSVTAWAADLANTTTTTAAAGTASEARRPGFAVGKGIGRIIPHTGYGLRAAARPRLLVGVPGWPGGGSGYVPGAQLAGVVRRVKRRLARAGHGDVLGGVMVWDGPEALANVDAQGRTFVDDVAAALG